jgi:hypothetical protein
MPDPAFQIKNLDHVVAAFAGAPQVIEDEIGKAIATIMGLAADRLADEPAPPPQSRYVRTHALSGEWRKNKPRFVVAGNSKRAVLRNTQPYARWVQARETQAQIHRGRWATVEQVEEDLAPDAAQELEAAGNRALNRIAGAI